MLKAVGAKRKSKAPESGVGVSNLLTAFAARFVWIKMMIGTYPESDGKPL